MAESKAAESYQAFESLRSRFGDTKQSPDRDSHAHQWREKPKRNVFASAATPLVPLVEEGDQLQEELFVSRLKPGQLNTSPVKGKWKYKSNHLNTPDVDAFETESVTSCSDSAYSSKSESLSPIAGSFTDLCDGGGSHDSHSTEHDLKKHGVSTVVYVKQAGRLAALKATFESGGDGGLAPSSSEKLHDSDKPDKTHDSDSDSVSSVVVPQRTKAWNKAIGEWMFEGVEALTIASPQDSPRVRRPSNEVRLPTPVSTPLYGSLENLADSGSRSSLFSGSGFWDEGEDAASLDSDAKYPLGKFVPAEARRPSIASCSQKASDSPPQVAREDHNTAPSGSSFLKPPSSDVTLVRGCKENPGENTITRGSIERKPIRSKATAWIEAKKKYELLKQKKEYGEDKGEETERQLGREKKLSAEDPVSTVEQRARLFGGTKPRRGLRRTQSLLVHSRSSPRMTRQRSARDMSNSFM